jgi:hypothetical protein
MAMAWDGGSTYTLRQAASRFGDPKHPNALVSIRIAGIHFFDREDDFFGLGGR